MRALPLLLCCRQASLYSPGGVGRDGGRHGDVGALFILELDRAEPAERGRHTLVCVCVRVCACVRVRYYGRPLYP